MAIIVSRSVNMCHEEIRMQGSLTSEWCPNLLSKMELARLKCPAHGSMRG